MHEQKLHAGTTYIDMSMTIKLRLLRLHTYLSAARYEGDTPTNNDNFCRYSSKVTF